MAKGSARLEHELASLDGPPPEGLPPALLAKRLAYRSAFELMSAARHAYFTALAAHYNIDHTATPEAARAWYVLQIGLLHRLIAEREEAGLEAALHRQELDRLTNEAALLGVEAIEPRDGAPAYDNPIDE